jgi:hypothetical protein
MSWAQKQPRFPKDMNKGKLNFKFQIMKQEHNMGKIKFQQNFIIITRKRTKQGCDKRMYPKLVFNKLKVMGNSTSIYTHWAPNSRKFPKKFSTYM